MLKCTSPRSLWPFRALITLVNLWIMDFHVLGLGCFFFLSRKLLLGSRLAPFLAMLRAPQLLFLAEFPWKRMAWRNPSAGAWYPFERLARRCKHIYRNFIASERSILSGLCIFCKLPNAASKKCSPWNELSLSISYLYVYHGWSFSEPRHQPR